MTYERDILDEFADRKKAPAYREVVAQMGMLVEDRSSGFCGDVVKITFEALTLRDRKNEFRHFRWKEGGFLIDGKPVTLIRAASSPVVRAGATRTTNSGSVASPGSARARVARAARIWVEGKHDAELVEHVWGDDLRELGIVVEPLHGIDDLAGAVREFRPAANRRLGVLVDHLVAGSKESRIAAEVRDPNVLITGHPFVDVWVGVRPQVLGLTEWPDVPRGQPWKQGLCEALGTDLATFWPRLRNRVSTYAELRPELVGAVERLIDFVSEMPEDDD
ncbi:unannotated protein [freshwater metagenome]|uniref:Unannotated protein n=1 Tax=freshwater metagenome TaxID=449393 RepID=A0A6J7EVC9_9ZZZZ|nr:DUF3097 family protein [Actinomycetota bacterium]